jgi:hypothetical protein
MKNIHVLPTNKLIQNIYITSDEEIKEGDWLLIIDDFETYVHKHKGDNLPTTYHKKIILTTDQDLIKDGVQVIDDEFLEWFVKNPSCEEVKIRKIGEEWIYNADVPKEEPKQDYSGVHLRHCYQGEYKDGCKYGENDCPAKPLEPKQETLEEVAENMWLDPIKNLTSKMSFIAGAKWQQEQDKNKYNEEDMIAFAEFIAKYPDKNKNVSGEMLHAKSKYDGSERTIDLLQEWIKQFKKK